MHRLSDTTPEAEKIQLEILSGLNEADRISICLNLTAQVCNLADQSLIFSSSWELLIARISSRYGEDLASKVQIFMDQTHARR